MYVVSHKHFWKLTQHTKAQKVLYFAFQSSFIHFMTTLPSKLNYEAIHVLHVTYKGAYRWFWRDKIHSHSKLSKTNPSRFLSNPQSTPYAFCMQIQNGQMTGNYSLLTEFNCPLLQWGVHYYSIYELNKYCHYYIQPKKFIVFLWRTIIIVQQQTHSPICACIVNYCCAHRG